MDEYVLSSLILIVKWLWQLKLIRQRRINHFKPFEPNKIVWQKVSTAQFDWLTCTGSTYIFCAAVTKIAIFVMIAHSLCAVPAYWAMVTQINCAIVGDRVYSVGSIEIFSHFRLRFATATPQPQSSDWQFLGSVKLRHNVFQFHSFEDIFQFYKLVSQVSVKSQKKLV